MPESNSRAFQVLDIEEMLPLLASSYTAGRLVPFIGAGMSRRKLAGWEGFVQNLEKEVAIQSPELSGHIEVRAQRAIAALRNSCDDEGFRATLTEALKGEDFDKPGPPDQTLALAEIYWPLTISTNYDHLFYCACRSVFKDHLPPKILGRGADDCKQVMSALVNPFDRETIWHIQGFLGEDCPVCPTPPVSDVSHLDRLRRELVFGHAEYRRAANTAVHFRRCFGEVFRSRSFLFLGSSLSEEYFWNLFGETLELCGPSPMPHFALMPEDADVDVRFLAEEMNIVVCRYDLHKGGLAPCLRQLKKTIEGPGARMSRWELQLKRDSSCSSLTIAPYSHLPRLDPYADRAVAIGVRACPKGHFELDQDLSCPDLKRIFADSQFDPGKHVLSPQANLFAVRARTKPEEETENDAVGAAITELLDQVKPSTLHLYLPSAGGTVPPVYGFIEAVRAFGKWAAASPRGLNLSAHVGHQVLLNLTSHQIRLDELVTSNLLRFWAIITTDDGQNPTRRVLYKPPTDGLGDILMELLGLTDKEALENWSTSLCPCPKRTLFPLGHKDLDKSLADAGVVFGSVLTLVRTSQAHGTSVAKLDTARALVRGGMSVTKAAKQVRIGRSTLYRYLENESVPQTSVPSKKGRRNKGTNLGTVLTVKTGMAAAP
jgi:hypothetical protein